MNYLAHAFLSFNDPLVLTGNMIGDHVKGKLALEKYPQQVQKGIMLHRKIDGFADVHPATLRAKVWFRQTYGLYSGAVMDTIYDHFLANDPKCFASEKVLLAFTQKTYQSLEDNKEWMPEKFVHYFAHMQQYNWLYNYRTVKGTQQSLMGLERRAKYMAPSDDAYKTFITQYYQLAQCYYEIMDDLIAFVKIELTH